MFVESIFILETTHSWEIVQTNLQSFYSVNTVRNSILGQTDCALVFISCR